MAKVSILQDPAVAIVAGIFGLAYYIPLVVPATIKYFSPAISLGLEIWLTIWWIVSLGVTAHDFGGVTCSNIFYSDIQTGCQTGQATLAFSVIGFVVSLVTLGLVSFYSVHPLVSQNLGSQMTKNNVYSLGGVVPVAGFATAADLEKGAAAPVEAPVVDDGAVLSAPVDNATARTQSTEVLKETEPHTEPIGATKAA